MWNGVMAVFCVVGLTAVSVPATNVHCDRSLPISLDNPFGYRLRVDRCEGLYVQPVAVTPLMVASFGRIQIPEALPVGGALLVEWMPESGTVRLRAHSLKSKTYYRMDSRQPDGSRAYRWPTDVLRALKLTAKDVGMVAWTERNIGGASRMVYLPVRVGQSPAPGEDVYELVLVPGNELSEVFVVLSNIRDGQRAQVTDPKPLRYGFYPAGRSIRIPIGPLPRPGTYVVEIGATLRGGGALSHEIWFSHAR